MESKLALVFGARHLQRIRKGSDALDGVSLTVNDVAGDDFTVLIIPHTLTVTTFGTLARGDRVNLKSTSWRATPRG
jgi:riboflavin synthase alpha subunit